MKSLAFLFAIYVGLTIWASVQFPWLAPAFLAFAMAEAMNIAVARRWWKPANPRGFGRFVVARLALRLFGMIYFFGALIGGRPEHAVFWIVFAAGFVVFMPVVLLASVRFDRKVMSG